jgi:sialate O-acetylesterase
VIPDINFYVFNLNIITMKKNIIIILSLFGITVTQNLTGQTATGKEKIDLRGEWLFTTGDNMEYADPAFNDSKWSKITVPGRWENFGYPDYDGFAWYRTSFHLPANFSTYRLVIQLGMIDDVDQVYLNGHFIGGKGNIPPEYFTAYNIPRIYNLPQKYLYYNKKNYLAIRVYDEKREGGIVSGKVGIYPEKTLIAGADLSGSWKFHIDDNEEWSELNYNDSGWDDIIVPATWEPQGYPLYDGFAWYRKKVIINDTYENEKYLLILGKIDDVDEVFFNGVKIGKSGKFPREEYDTYNQRYWNRRRVYWINPTLINWNNENIIAVRVYDCGGMGGIYEGPVRLISYSEYKEEKWDNKISDNTSKFEDFFGENFEDFFDHIIEFLDDLF